MEYIGSRVHIELWVCCWMDDSFSLSFVMWYCVARIQVSWIGCGLFFSRGRSIWWVRSSVTSGDLHRVSCWVP